MSIANNTAEVLNDLIQINNDRIEGYKKAMEELKATDTDLQTLFSGFISQSQELKAALELEVASLGEEIVMGTTASGKIYRTWMDVKAAFTGANRKAVLESCEFGEDAAQSAYKTAGETEDILPNARMLIGSQKMELKASHDKVKILRDNESL